jgi:hypothetical protein
VAAVVTEHPTPWSVSQRYGTAVFIRDANGETVETVYDRQQGDGGAERLAERIVRAVNDFEGTCEACGVLMAPCGRHA